MNAIKFCKRCLYTTAHPLGLIIDSSGICSGCRIHEEKYSLDWFDRFNKLKILVQPYRSRSGVNYDCVVPVTGGQDSYYIVFVVKELLGLNPLLVHYNKYFNTSLGIRNLANLRIKFNVDIVFQNVNINSVKNISRTTLNQFGSIYWPALAGHTVFPVQTAVRYKIPLIIWGAHQGLEQVGMFSHENEVEMTRRYRKDHDLLGYEADDLLSFFNTLKEEDIWQYRYPEDSELNPVGVRGIYLGNYMPWDPKSQHERMIKGYNYTTSKLVRTFDMYDFIDCFNYINLHDQFKLFKHGFSKVTDHATREIRHGRMTRHQGLSLVLQYEQVSPEYSALFREWLGITPNSLQFLMNQFRNPNYWIQNKFESYSFNGLSLQQDIYSERVGDDNSKFSSEYIINEKSSLQSESYITFGKGWPE